MSESKGRPEQNWLRQWLARARGRGPGDVIAAQIGEGAENIAVGKYILQTNVRIGTLVVPVRFIAVLLSVALALAFVAWLALVPDRMPQDTFNVAVADFGQLDGQGRVHHSQDGSRLSQWMFGKLQSEASTLPREVKVELWHDSLGWLLKRAPIGLISTEAQAAALAKRINAHMIIYGTLDAGQDAATFTPEFYVADVRSEAAEVVGSQQLGAPIPYRPPVNFNDLKTGVHFDQNLKPRAEALIWFTHGLALDLTGRYDQALRVFQQAVQKLGDVGDPGSEVLYYFVGREAVFLASDQNEAKKAFASVEDALTAAEQAFQKSLEVGQYNYDRAFLGLGNVYMQRAQLVLAARRTDAESLEQARADLDRATARYHESLRRAESPASVVGLRAQLSLGMVDYLRAATFLFANDDAEADRWYQSAIGQLSQTVEQVGKDQHRVRAQTFQTLGAAYFAQGHVSRGDRFRSLKLWDESVRFYQQCLAEIKQEPYDTFLASFEKQHCTPEMQTVIQARDKLKAES